MCMCVNMCEYHSTRSPTHAQMFGLGRIPATLPSLRVAHLCTVICHCKSPSDTLNFGTTSDSRMPKPSRKGFLKSCDSSQNYCTEIAHLCIGPHAHA